MAKRKKKSHAYTNSPKQHRNNAKWRFAGIHANFKLALDEHKQILVGSEEENLKKVRVLLDLTMANWDNDVRSTG